MARHSAHSDAEKADDNELTEAVSVVTAAPTTIIEEGPACLCEHFLSVVKTSFHNHASDLEMTEM